MKTLKQATVGETVKVVKLHGEGENRDDVWDKYFVGGELVEKVYAVMFMPEPKKVKWEV